MYAVGKLGSYISAGVYTVSAPFHPFGGAVDIIVVEQQDGTFKTSPWYVRFGKFQGVLKTREKVVSINVNGVDADFHMYLDHKGEAYFLQEVDIEEEAVAYQSSSGEDTDGQPRRPIKTKSCNYDGQIDVNNGQVVVRSGSRRGRLLGLVFGKKSIKENNISEENSGSGVLRANSLESAEIAADLLDVKWSTNLASKNSGKDKTSRFGGADLVDGTADKGFKGSNDQSSASPATPTLDDTACATKKVSFAPNEALEASTSVDNHENLSGHENENDLDEYDKFSSHGPDEIEMKTFQSFEGCETSEYSRLDKNSERDPVPVHAEIVQEISEPEVYSLPVSSMLVANESISKIDNPINVINDTTSSAASNSVENEVSSVSGFSDSVHQGTAENNAIDENNEGDIQLHQGLNDSPSGFEEPQFVFSDLDGLKVNEATCTETCSPDCLDKLDLTIIGTEAMKDMSSKNYEALSSLDECVNANLQRQVSNPIDILGFREVVRDRVERKAVSLPNMRSHISDLGPHDLHHSCSALDLDTKSSKWALLRENAPSCIKLNAEDEHQLAEGQLTVGDTQISGELLNVPSSPARGDLSEANVAPSGNWGMWPFSFRRSTPLNVVEPGLNRTMSTPVVEKATEGTSDEVEIVANKIDIVADKVELKPKDNKKKVRVITPTSEQLASLNLKDGCNIITFTFSTAMLGKQQVDARIYLWKWNTRVVISDVDGTITKSDVLGQFMPWVGVDWSQTGVTHLFSAIKENGYQLLFLSARAISQAYLTRQFLLNLTQDGKALPDGPVVISPDGLFPSLFREVIRRAPHEFKIACLEDIKALFPSDVSPFYAGFGNRDTDEISYLKVGIPIGKIFIINPKGEVAVNRRVNTKSYPSLHSLVHDMFPPMSSTEREDFNSWNYWKLPPPTLHG